MLTFEDLKNKIRECATDMELEEHKAFIFFVLEEIMDISPEEAREYVIDGPYDGGIDVIYPREEDNELLILQSKYTENIDTNTLEQGVKDLIKGVKYVFNDGKTPPSRLNEKIEKLGIKTLIGKGDLILKAVFITSAKVGATKGDRRKIEKKYNKNLNDFLAKQKLNTETSFGILDFRAISEALGELPGIEGVSFALLKGEYFIKPNETAIVFTISGPRLADFVDQFGEDLFENNVRSFLGFRGNVNKAIRETLKDDDERRFFWFYNNGIVGVCENFELREQKVIFKNFSIINGAQTANILQEVKDSLFTIDDATLLMKVINLNRIPETEKFDMVGRITLAANSQNPTNTRDLRAVDRIQKMLEEKLKNLGYQYIRRRGIRIRKTNKTIFMKDIAQAYVSFYLDEPFTAYSRVNEVFGKNDYYEQVFPKTILDGNDMEISKIVDRYLLSHKLLKSIRDHIKRGITSVPLALAYHSLWAFKEMCNLEKIDLDNTEPDSAEDFALKIFNNYKDKVFTACKLAYANLQATAEGFELPKSAKSRDGYERFKQFFKTNYSAI